ncbi:diglucosylglycerate octanoyltransferase, partial [Nocardia lasii]
SGSGTADSDPVAGSDGEDAADPASNSVAGQEDAVAADEVQETTATVADSTAAHSDSDTVSENASAAVNAVGNEAPEAAGEHPIVDPLGAQEDSVTAGAAPLVQAAESTVDVDTSAAPVGGSTVETSTEVADSSAAGSTPTGEIDSAATQVAVSAAPIDTGAVGDSAGPAVVSAAPTATGAVDDSAAVAVDGSTARVVASAAPNSTEAVDSSAVPVAVIAPTTATDTLASAPASVDAEPAELAPAAPLLAEPTLSTSVLESPARQEESTTVATTEAPLVQQVAAPRPVESAAPRPVLLVIADSLAYYGPKGGLPADDPRIWPNMVAAELDWDVELIARIGWTCRDAYWALIGDPRVWAAVPRAGAVVFAVGGMDTLPSPLPTALREMIRYIRPPRLRRGVRASYNWLQPKLSKLGRPVALPPRVSVDYLEQSRTALNHLRPELPVVAVLPSVHRCEAYGRVHRGRARAVKALQAWSGRTSVPLVDLGEAVREDIESGSANPDGIHWGWAGHAAVATAMTKALQEVK